MNSAKPIGMVDAYKAFVTWATEHPVRYQKHLDGKGRIANTRARRAAEHKAKGDGVKAAA